MNIGIIGLGFMGATHIAGYAKIPGVKVAAVCTENPAVLAGDLSKIGGNIKFDSSLIDISTATKYQRWEDLVANRALDAVDICLPTDLHPEVSIAALASGKHVLCEKPMALTEAGCEQMIEAAEKAKKTLMIGQVLRFWPEYLALQEYKNEKSVGKLRSATFLRQCGTPNWSKWLTRDERSGGAVLDLLIHDIDQALLLCGMPDRVAAKKLGDGDGLMATLIYPGGPEVRIQGGWFHPDMPLKMTFQAVTDQGQIDFSNESLFITDLAGIRRKLNLSGPDGYQMEVEYFIDCCRRGEEPALCTPRSSAQAVKVALKLKESRAKDGEPIKC